MANYKKSTIVGVVLDNQHKEEMSKIEQGGPIPRATALAKVIETLKEAGVDVTKSDPIALLTAAGKFIDGN